jgi:hypothetical protein
MARVLRRTASPSRSTSTSSPSVPARLPHSPTGPALRDQMHALVAAANETDDGFCLSSAYAVVTATR